VGRASPSPTRTYSWVPVVGPIVGAVKVHYGPDFIMRADVGPINGKVAVISGGGSGHEPMHGGFVGMGMLDAACPGAVFTSPTPDQMLEATKAVNGGAGVLHIVKNYTGDMLNFEMAADLAMAEGIEVESVVIDDDVAVKDSLYTAGRRGVGATVLAEKIAARPPKQGAPWKCAEICRKANEAGGRSMGMALTSCTVPARRQAHLRSSRDEMEIGIGIHGEPGRTRMPLRSADEITEMLMDHHRSSHRPICPTRKLTGDEVRSSWSTAWAAPR
jgi:dihydroxyacetone kinase-like protein